MIRVISVSPGGTTSSVDPSVFGWTRKQAEEFAVGMVDLGYVVMWDES